MPPPPPNFLPAAVRRNRRPLDPTRHLQSRELWNKVRFHASAKNIDGSNNNKSASSWLYYKALIQAILYEIQPFRIKPCYHRLIIFLREEDGLRHALTTSVNKTIHMLGSMQKLCRLVYNLLRQYGNMQSIQQHKHTIGKATLTLIGLKLYHRTLLYLHELLHAGPILIILTLFTLLYTIGLGDNTGANSGVPSAYSVFNRGMRRILGTVDAEDLARQYAGGAAAAAMGGGNDNVHRRDGGGIWVPHDDDDDSNGEDEDDENRLRNERRRQRRLERLQRRNNHDNDANDHNNNDDNVNEQVNNDVDDDLDDDIQNDSSTQADENASEANTGGARKTGKKARRRNLELRREMQRQRQAAAANGFGRGNGDDEVAMDHLIGEVAD
ncbi:SAYSvFN domain-containing protein [Skeletonema marinoi]|uniref:SAYSvFN domain-containing protein n=1 Tax=Skeletonema marinoi TaxID=267567 RepID=A0AAD9DA76_9STRA|nr:SAYSvFN domain-containing protein [Skeletonema marinoi]